MLVKQANKRHCKPADDTCIFLSRDAGSNQILVRKFRTTEVIMQVLPLAPAGLFRKSAEIRLANFFSSFPSNGRPFAPGV